MKRLVETKLFKLLQDNRSSESELDHAFNGFFDELIRRPQSKKELCSGIKETQRAFVTLVLLESKIRHANPLKNSIDIRLHYIQSVKMLLEFQMESFKYLYINGQFEDSKISQSQHQWTGSKSDLVELTYALSESKCINNGDIQIEKFTQDLAMFFGLEVSKSSRIFTNIKLRKAKSRTFFLDKLAEKLNYRMNKDDEK